MDTKPPLPLATQVAAAFDWWREAGVDADFADNAAGWLADPVAATTGNSREEPPRRIVETAPPPPPPVQPVGGDSANWPDTLPEFRQWWLADPSLDEGGIAPRVASRGDVGAELMVLIAQPEESDTERLLSGPTGALLDGFFNAAGIDRDKAAVVAALPRHTPVPDWRGLADRELGKLLSYHVSLYAPKRMLILGRNILPLCGHDLAQGAATLQIFNHDRGEIPAMAEVGPERLLANAASRARLWQRWLDWTDR
ncbi:hypothetical protein D6858_11830 [Tsuneonella suprasediminis]|uniref:Uracil DNA glycosylase superfamily protein n=1 Tax=Tsuneonella suprasediminis TaxID=2306996 RepID=A0A419R0K0_9SPHN|nr:hypothetical protein [Tsuneonella suprasediminis]RJX67018.1 hypothetical protein D6858_11830 [Tsuneonella suprasediminis]